MKLLNKPITYFVQHPDDVVGRKSFEYLEATFTDTLFVRSEFATLQGEGPFAGQYAYFIRLAGCNYGSKTTHCKFCDTDFRMSLSQMRSFSGLREAWSNKKCDLVVVTGGEPTLQQKVVDLCIKYPDTHFQFETNGTQTEVVHRLLDLPNVTVVISPKYSVTGAMITPTDKMLDLATFKFLVSADSTHYEYVLPEWTFKCKKPVYLSPIAVYLRAYEGEVTNAWDQTLIDTESTRMNYAHAANMVQSLSEYTGNRNIRLSIQQHLFTSIP